MKNLNFNLVEKNNYNNFFKNAFNNSDNENKQGHESSNNRIPNEELNQNSNAEINTLKHPDIKLMTVVRRKDAGNFKKNNSLTSSADLIKLKNKAQVNIGFWFYLKSAFCKLKTKSDLIKNKIFLFMTNFFNERIDLIYYLETLNNIDKLKKLFLNDIHKKSLEICIKPNVLNEEQLKQLGYFKKEKDELSEIKIIKYYRKKIENNYLETLDYKLLDILPKYLLDQIKFDTQSKDALESAN